MIGDILSPERDRQPGEPLLQEVMKEGRRTAPPSTLAEIRARAAQELARLPEPLCRLDPPTSYPVRVADVLRDLAADVDRRLVQ